MLRLLARSIIVIIAIVKSDAKLGLKLIVLPVFKIEGVAGLLQGLQYQDCLGSDIVWVAPLLLFLPCNVAVSTSVSALLCCSSKRCKTRSHLLFSFVITLFAS